MRAGDMVPIRRLSVLYGALFFELGINLPFLPVWLRAQSLSDVAVGIVVAAPFYVRLVANPLVSALADRHGRHEDIVATCAVVVAMASAMLMAADGFATILAVVVVIAFAQGPLIALTDAVTLTRLAHASGRFDRYGGIRLWGSVAFALANLGVGTILVWVPASAIALFLAAAASLVAVAAVAVARAPRARATSPARAATLGPCARLLRPRILLVVVGAALIQASHGVFYAFGTLHWQASGLSSVGIGGLWALGIVCEIGFFVLLDRLPMSRRGPGALLLLGGVAAGVRWLGMATDPTGIALVPLQMLHAVSFGATHAGGIFLLARLAPVQHQAQIQGWLAAAWAGLMAIVISLAGYLTPTWGEATYLLMAAAAATGTVLVAPACLGRATVPADAPAAPCRPPA